MKGEMQKLIQGGRIRDGERKMNGGIKNEKGKVRDDRESKREGERITKNGNKEIEKETKGGEE